MEDQRRSKRLTQGSMPQRYQDTYNPNSILFEGEPGNSRIGAAVRNAYGGQRGQAGGTKKGNNVKETSVEKSKGRSDGKEKSKDKTTTALNSIVTTPSNNGSVTNRLARRANLSYNGVPHPTTGLEGGTLGDDDTERSNNDHDDEGKHSKIWGFAMMSYPNN